MIFGAEEAMLGAAVVAKVRREVAVQCGEARGYAVKDEEEEVSGEVRGRCEDV